MQKLFEEYGGAVVVLIIGIAIISVLTKEFGFLGSF